MAETNFLGPVRSGTGETDGSLFLPAIGGSGSIALLAAASWTQVRSAGGNYSQALATTGVTGQIVVDLGQIIQKIGADPDANRNAKHAFRGIQLVSFDVVYSIATLALTSITPTLYQTTYANNVAASINATPGGVLVNTLQTATQANPYVTNVVVTTPYVIGKNAADIADYLEIVVVAPNTSAFNVTGIDLKFNYNLL